MDFKRECNRQNENDTKCDRKFILNIKRTDKISIKYIKGNVKNNDEAIR